MDRHPTAEIHLNVRTTPIVQITVSRLFLNQRLRLRERSDRPNVASLSAAHHEIDGPRSFERSDRPKLKAIWTVHSSSKKCLPFRENAHCAGQRGGPWDLTSVVQIEPRRFFPVKFVLILVSFIFQQKIVLNFRNS